jgi:hypothetical protein
MVSKISIKIFNRGFGKLSSGWFARFIQSGFGVFRIRQLFLGQRIAKNFVGCKIKSGWLWFWFLGKESGATQVLPTKRAADFWESAASRSIFLASSFFCSQALSQPAQNPLTQTVSPLLPKKFFID